jgi:queuine/archaeosine tRNA-ribosyltransferase
MKMNGSVSSAGKIGSYVQLQHQIHNALREQHPEWVEQNGDCPTCESYESRFAELLHLLQENEGKSAA